MSFILDPLLLITSGIVEVYIVEKWLHKYINKKEGMLILSFLVIVVFWGIAGALYLDLISLSFIGEAGNGNHFMWNSGIELLGIPPFVDTSTPTYINPFCVLNILAVVLFGLYPAWLYLGIICGLKIIKRKYTGS